MRLAVVVPIKSYRRAKHRLNGVLSEEERMRLAVSMTEDVLGVVSRLREHGRFVVSDDQEVLRAARRLGLEAVEDQASQGQSAAVRQGFDLAWQRGFPAALTIPGDVPAVTLDELEELCAFQPEVEVLLSPDREGQGTNGLRLVPPHAIALRFGDDSHRLHRAEAAQAHRSFGLMELDGLGCDLDRPEDLAAFVALGRDTATLGLLQEMRVADRVAGLPQRHG